MYSTLGISALMLHHHGESAPRERRGLSVNETHGRGGAAAEPPMKWTAGGMHMRVAMMAALAGAIAFAGPAFALDKVTFGTNWVADPEAGGYYQALVDGTFAKYGLDVTIMQGGPMSNGGMLLIAGKIEFFMGGDMIGDFLAVENNIPTIAVAAHFQKNPQIFMSHPGVGLDKWQDLPAANPAFVSSGAVNTFWAWMRLAYGFKDEISSPTTSIRLRSSLSRVRSSRAI